jgi:Ca2+-transporting ATPase
MEVESIDSSDEGQLLEAIVIANDADPSAGSGDPIDQGLLRFAAARGVDVAAVRRRRPERSRRAFDSRVKFSRTTVGGDQSGDVSYLKGAPEVLIARCRAADEQRRHWRQQAETRAREGFRVLAVARGSGEAENELEWLGLVSFWDPPRPEVPDAVARALAAGIRVVMITGDHPATALAVARRIGIPGDRVMTGDDLERHQGPVPATLDGVNVFARVRPEQKLAIVTALQEATHIVAMTGDGVNDAPALKRADIGVAMGQRGSEVSREVADLVLLDDNFATIVRAVEQGRGIYENVQKFLRFLFSTNLSEVLLIASGVLLAFALGLRDNAGALMLPLTAAQVLWINLMTDGLPAIALALDRTPGLMSQAPRPPQSPLLDVPSTRFIVSVGIMKAAVGLAVLGGIPLLGYDLVTTRTVTFHFMAIGQLVLTYSARHTATHPLSNPFLHAAVAGGIALQVAAGTWHSTSTLLGLSTMPPLLWGAVAVGALVVLGLAEVIASIAHRRSTRTISGPDGPESTPGNQQVTGSAA